MRGAYERRGRSCGKQPQPAARCVELHPEVQLCPTQVEVLNRVVSGIDTASTSVVITNPRQQGRHPALILARVALRVERRSCVRYGAGTGGGGGGGGGGGRGEMARPEKEGFGVWRRQWEGGKEGARLSCSAHQPRRKASQKLPLLPRSLCDGGRLATDCVVDTWRGPDGDMACARCRGGGGGAGVVLHTPRLTWLPATDRLCIRRSHRQPHRVRDEAVGKYVRLHLRASRRPESTPDAGSALRRERRQAHVWCLAQPTLVQGDGPQLPCR